MALGPYLRRRWRVVGFLIVVMAGTALFSFLLDRGHDPLWAAEVPGAEIVAVAPDGSRVYVLSKVNGTVRDVVALDADGAELWRRSVPGDAPHALLDATDGLVAVATVARNATSQARLLTWAPNGTAGLAERLPFTARALAVEDRAIAVAVEDSALRFPVLTWRNLTRGPTLAWNESVQSLDLESGALAAGTSAGRILVVDPDGAEVLNASRGFRVDQVRLDAEARFLAVGGREFGGGGGRVEFFRIRDAAPDVPRWQNLTRSEIRFLDLSRDGGRVLALASPAGADSEIHLFDSARGSTSPWKTLKAGGIVHPQGTSTAAGIRLSPDGRHVVFGTLTGPIVLYEYGPEPVRLWQHDALGTTSLAWPERTPGTFFGDASYSAPKGTDRVLRLDVDSEPFVDDLGRFVPTALALELVLGGALLGAGYARRPTSPR